MAFKDHIADIERLVVADRDKSGMLTDSSLELLTAAYKSPIFFVPSVALLRGHAKPINDALIELEDRLGIDQLSRQTEINAAAKGDGITLKAALRLDRSMALLKIHAAEALRRQLTLLFQDPARPHTKALVKQSLHHVGLVPIFEEPRIHFFGIPTLGIVPAFLRPDSAVFADIEKRMVIGPNLLSQAVWGRGKHHVFSYLVDKHAPIRVTQHFADHCSQRLAEELAAGRKKKFSAKELHADELFEIDGKFRKTETALSFSNGNRVPGMAQYQRAAA